MTDGTLALRRDHLAHNRRMIVARSIASALAGAVPIPIFEDWLASRVRRGLIRRIADRRGVDVTDEAVIALADGREDPPSWTKIASGTFIVRALSRSWRKMLVTYLAAQRARAAARTFEVATMFDHYCARLHVGLGLDAGEGARVRALIDDSRAAIGAGLTSTMFRRGVGAAARATVRAPAELLDMASGGAIRRLLARNDDEVVAIAEVDDAIERSMDEADGFLGRAIAAVEAQLSAEGNPHLEQLLNTFETLWRDDQDSRK